MKVAVLFLVGYMAASPLPLSAQDAGTTTPREARFAASKAMSQGAYADAIVYLQQLVDWYGSSKKDSTLVQMEMVYFNLGICHFLLGQFSEARTAFSEYLKKYRTGMQARLADIYIADSLRFEEKLGDALKRYRTILHTYDLGADLKADVLMSMARCYLAQDKWDKVIPVLRELYKSAPDPTRRNWAASMLTTAFLKENQVAKVYQLIPYLLQPNSFASRSVAFNMAALEAGDALFGEEKYRDALWIYRLVYPHDVLAARSQAYLERLQKRADALKRNPEEPRMLMRVQEEIGEVESSIKALEGIDNYDIELYFRMARAYMEVARFREGRELFLYLHGVAGEPRANEALYMAFQCSTRVQPWDRALEIGLDYMTKYPAGEYYDDVSIMVGQIYAKEEDWPKVIEVLTKALEVSPKHSQAAEAMFLIGYANFMEEKFEESVEWYRKMNTTFPGNPRELDGTYWIGMGLMFQQKFDEAAPAFDKVLERVKDNPYVMDARFRRAVCDFGVSRFKEAEARFTTFVVDYPTNTLSGEAWMMLGDIAGAKAELPSAVSDYKRVGHFDVNIEFYNYAMFRVGEMLNEMRDFQGVIGHFKEYIERNREGSNIPMAIYWIGTSMKNLGEQRGALEYFRDAVEKYGVDRKALGIDLILEEWVGQGKSAEKSVAEACWADLEASRLKAEKAGQSALELRLKRVLLYQPGITDERKLKLTAELMREENIPNASSGVLEFMLEEAQKRKDRTLAAKIAEAIIKTFPETDSALQARMTLAQFAIADENYKVAIKHLTLVKEVYASSPEAAQALLMLGDVQFKIGKYKDADESYKSILAVREWKGPLWPAALYGRGECARAQRSYDQASAYYERIYVMYGKFTSWCAKAYLARADCLNRLSLYNKAAETLQEMVAQPEMKAQPEYAEAIKQLSVLNKP